MLTTIFVEDDEYCWGNGNILEHFNEQEIPVEKWTEATPCKEEYDAPVEPREHHEDGESSSTPELMDDLLLFPSPAEEEACRSNRKRDAIRTFYLRVRELKEFKDEHGHCDVPQKYEPNRPLGIWVNKIRAQKKVYDQDPRNSFLCLRKVASLDALQFSWGRQKGDVLWEQHFKELQRFHQEKGHCNVPTKPAPGSSYKTLGRFVSTQRTQYKLFHSSRGESKSLLNQSKIDRLNELNFCWDLSLPRKTPKSSLAKGTRRRTRSTPAESLCQPEGNEESSSPSTAAQPWEEV